MPQVLVLQFDESRFDEAYEQIQEATYEAGLWVAYDNGLDFVSGISSGPKRLGNGMLQYSINRYATVTQVYRFLLLCPDVRLVVIDI